MPDGNELQVAYNFRVNGDQLSGTAESPAGVVTIDDGQVVGNAVSFKVTVDGTAYAHRGTAAADVCALTIDFGGQVIEVTLRRSASP